MNKKRIILVLGILLLTILLVLILFAAFYSSMGEVNSSFIPIILTTALFITISTTATIMYITQKISNNDKNALRLAYTDDITGGITFSRFKQETEELFRKNPNGKYAIFYSDIKNFKYINDVYGFEIGNEILKRYSEWLAVEDKIVYARINADHFVSIELCNDKELMLKKCESRIERVSDVSDIVNGMPAICISAGIYCTDGDNLSITIDSMIDRANIAQKQIKNSRASGCILYDETFRLALLNNQKMENRMQYALENGEFVVYLQPKFDIRTDRVASAEALVRWIDPETGVIPPLEFIPLFEKNGFIKKLDTYMFEQVCILLRKWMNAGDEMIPVSVNVSKVQLSNPNFMKDYINIKKKYQIPDNIVEIEFTESILFDNGEHMGEVLRFFRDNGIRSSIDDFGAGYSSLNLLKDLPTDILKLDKMFFDENEYADREKVIIKNVIAMAKELDMQTVAEGVEHMEQVAFLKSVQCEMVQGYVFDRPLPASEFEKKYIKMAPTSSSKAAAPF